MHRSTPKPGSAPPESAAGVRERLTPRLGVKCPTPPASASASGRVRNRTPSSTDRSKRSSGPGPVEKSKKPRALKFGTKMTPQEALQLLQMVERPLPPQKSNKNSASAELAEMLESIRSQSQPPHPQAQPQKNWRENFAPEILAKIRPASASSAAAKNLFNCDESAISISIPIGPGPGGGDSGPLPDLSDFLTPNLNGNGYANSTFSSSNSNSTVNSHAHAHGQTHASKPGSKVTIKPETLASLKKYGDLQNEFRSLLAKTYEQTKELEALKHRENLERALPSELLNETIAYSNRIYPLIQKYLTPLGAGAADFKSKLKFSSDASPYNEPGIPCEFSAKLQTVQMLEKLGETCKIIVDELDLNGNESSGSDVLKNSLTNSARQNLAALEHQVNSLELALEKAEEVQKDVLDILKSKEFEDITN